MPGQHLYTAFLLLAGLSVPTRLMAWPRFQRRPRVAFRTWLVCLAVFPLAAAADESTATPHHSTREVIEAIEGYADRFVRINRRTQIGAVSEILQVDFIGSGRWIAHLEGWFHFYPPGEMVSGRWACLTIRDSDLHPTDLRVFRGDSPNWAACRE